ncbi:MAG: 50S ribosomal protein L6 [Cytophagales bacterium]|nr:50S ribosomal protein L6 [Cytophagales bacterium]
MSRIGKKPISLPQGVDVQIAGSNLVTVKGPKGELSQQVDADLGVSLEEGVLSISRPTDQKRHKAAHGLYRSLLSNMIQGVVEGYKLELQLVGVGYRAVSTNNVLELNLGYSHPIFFQLPAEVKATANQEKGKDPIIVLESVDKQLIGQVAAKIRSLRKIEPYKGKGIRFVGEEIRRKAGKTGK